jgi:hypothetical protein
MIIVGENQMGGRPTLSYCMEYANQYGIPPEKTYIDHGQQFSFETTFTYVNPYNLPDGTFYLPWEAVLNGATMEYVYSSGDAPNTYYGAGAAIDALMMH